jgi:hypothetical protein
MLGKTKMKDIVVIFVRLLQCRFKVTFQTLVGTELQ